MPKRPISADSHITEPPNLYIDYIEAKYKDTAPHVVDDPDRGEVYTTPIPPVASAPTPSSKSCTVVAGTRRRGQPIRTATVLRRKSFTRPLAWFSAITKIWITSALASMRITVG